MATKPKTNETPATPAPFAPPPPRVSGDSIDLSALLGKTIAVKLIGKTQKATKFGEKTMAQVRIYSADQKQPLDGVLFSAYFVGLEVGRWFAGTLSMTKGNRRGWTLIESTDTAALAKLGKLILSDVPPAVDTDDEVPF